MKTYKAKFEENYLAIQEPCDNRKGFRMRYTYIGPWYVWNTSGERVRSVKRTVGILCVLSVMLFLCGSLMDSRLNAARYVEAFGTLSVAALLYEVIGVIQFSAAKEKMTSLDFDDIKMKMMLAPLLHGILLICAAAAAVIVLVGSKTGSIDIIVTLCYFFSGLLSLLIFQCYRSLPWRKDRNENPKIGPTKH